MKSCLSLAERGNLIASRKHPKSSIPLKAALCNLKCLRWCYRPGYQDFTLRCERQVQTLSASDQILISISLRAELISTMRPSNFPTRSPMVSLGSATPVQNCFELNYHLKVFTGPAHLNFANLHALCDLFQLQPPIPTYTMS